MAIRQMSVFIPNQEGALAEVTDILSQNGIDLRAITVYDTTEYGIMRCVVSDPDRAVVLLQAEGIVAKLSKVCCINPEDEPGSLSQIFKLLGENLINIDYIYSFVVRKNDDQYFVLKVNNVEKAEALLSESGVRVIHEF